MSKVMLQEDLPSMISYEDVFTFQAAGTEAGNKCKI